LIYDIEVEDPDSWPPEFRRKAWELRPLSLRYQTERRRIDRLAQADVSVRINPPSNQYQSEYLDAVTELETELSRHRIIGFHCTRLTPTEVTNIVQAGLKRLSPQFLYQRIDHCVAQGFLTESEGDSLRASDSIRHCVNNRSGRRTGLLWFCPNRSSLADYAGVSRFFRMWGGETVYWGHEDDSYIAAVLRRVGVPCVVRCAIPHGRALQHHSNFSERFLAQLLADKFENPEPPADFDLYTETDIAPTEVIGVFSAPGPEFAALTRFEEWPEQYRFEMPLEA
jgi:hypothetical protein